jgi:uncharacterized protein YfbU (UPF0304 family)
MQLSRIERWLLSNQFAILAALYPDEAKEYERMKEAVDSGYEFEFERMAQHVYAEGLPEDACKEVLEILSMFDYLKQGYERLSDKSGIDAHDITFIGFDGNNEVSYMGYAEFFCGQGRFGSLNIQDFNSHCPTIEMYRRMLQAHRESVDKYRLTKDDIVRITTARPYPQ